jgi:hypothetical protein
MLEVYSDESGIHGSRWLAVAGFVGPASDWRSFETLWAQVLRDFDVSCFHSTKFFGGAKPFGRWSAERRIALIDALTGAITHHKNLTIVSSAVDTVAFFSRTEHEREYLTGGMWDVIKEKWTRRGAPTKPFYLPFAYVFDKCNRSPQRVDWVHDRQDIYAEHAQRLHALAKSRRQPRAIRDAIGRLTFGSKEDVLPLQAADLAAYLTYYRVTHGLQPTESDLGRALDTFKRFGNVIFVYDEKTIDNHLRAALPRMVREGRKPSQIRAERRAVLGRQRQAERRSRR